MTQQLPITAYLLLTYSHIKYLTFISGPFAAVVVEKSSARVCAMIGCAGMGISLAIAGLTTSFPVFFLMYGLLAGETCPLRAKIALLFSLQMDCVPKSAAPIPNHWVFYF